MTRSQDLGFRLATGAFALVLVLLVCGIGVELARVSMPSIQRFGFSFWRTEIWDPVAGEFGALPFIWGTLYSSVLALLISTPIALGIAVFISELCPAVLRQPLVFLTELLAAIPAIVYGLWGIFVLVPAVRAIETSMPHSLRQLPLFTGPPLGLGMLSAALILSVMVIPFTSSVSREVLRSLPIAQREGAYAFCGSAVVVALTPLAFVLFFVVSQGARAVNLEFFTHMPTPVGEAGGGMANAIVGTLILTSLAAMMAVPIGVISGVYMSEYAGTRFAALVRFAADTLNGVPSIVIGLFAYAVVVVPFKQFSALAGGFALGTMMIPIIARTTEELLLLVPGSMREGALALGATRARAVFSVVLPAALPGIMTGIVLALARIAGETAPLLFTAFNNRFFNIRLTQPISSLTVQVYTYAMSPYADWHRQAWAGALVLVTIVFACSLAARFATRRLERMHGRA